MLPLESSCVTVNDLRLPDLRTIVRKKRAFLLFKNTETKSRLPK